MKERMHTHVYKKREKNEGEKDDLHLHVVFALVICGMDWGWYKTILACFQIMDKKQFFVNIKMLSVVASDRH